MRSANDISQAVNRYFPSHTLPPGSPTQTVAVAKIVKTFGKVEIHDKSGKRDAMPGMAVNHGDSVATSPTAGGVVIEVSSNVSFFLCENAFVAFR